MSKKRKNCLNQITSHNNRIRKLSRPMLDSEGLDKFRSSLAPKDLLELMQNRQLTISRPHNLEVRLTWSRVSSILLLLEVTIFFLKKIKMCSTLYKVRRSIRIIKAKRERINCFRIICGPMISTFPIPIGNTRNIFKTSTTKFRKTTKLSLPMHSRGSLSQ
jgi:hypothetical protein